MLQAQDVYRAALATEEEIVGLRRELHHFPEPSYHEEQTAGLVAGELRRSGLEVREGIGGFGVLGRLAGSRPGPWIALRADMDALPIQELSTHPWRSARDGFMHACGHDAHMAILLGVARVLSQARSEMAGGILFLFQPAEEMLPGGAAAMLQAGVFEPPPAFVFGLHNSPDLPTGLIGYREGVLMAATNEFTLEILGEGNHASTPHRGVDSILVAAEVVLALQALVSRETDPLEPAVLSFGQIRGGEAFNVIPGRVEMKGTLRSLETTGLERLCASMERMVSGIAQANRADYRLNFTPGYPALVNDPGATELAWRAAAEILGPERVRAIPKPFLGGEDFARFLELVPGSYLILGVGNPDVGADRPWHHAEFQIDEGALAPGVAAMSWIAWRALEAAAGA